MLSLKLVGGVERSDGAHLLVQVPAAAARFAIGRDPACEWALPDRTLALSARHCEIVRSAAGWVLRDLSTNGTFVNGAKSRLTDDHVLRDGDRIEAGPFTLRVDLSADEAAPHPMPTVDLPTEPLARTPAVDDTAPLVMAPGRGRDPAAVHAAVPPPPAGDDLGLTRIRPAPGAAVRPAAVPAQAPPAAPASPPAGTPEPELLAAIAGGLGLPVTALAGRDPAELAGQIGRIARAAVDGLRQLLDEQVRSRRRIGSRRQAELRSATPLRLAASTDEALLALLAADPGGPLNQAAAELSAHQERLLSAYRSAMQSLGEDLAPATLARAMPAADAARQWALYANLWQRLGLSAEGSTWPEGFVEAALLHLAAAYDQDPAV